MLVNSRKVVWLFMHRARLAINIIIGGENIRTKINVAAVDSSNHGDLANVLTAAISFEEADKHHSCLVYNL